MQAVGYLQDYVWNASGDPSASWNALLVVLKPLAVGVDHVTQAHMDLFFNEFKEQINEAAKNSFYPSGRVDGADNRPWEVYEAPFSEECVLAKLLRGLASLENDETRSALLDSLVDSGLVDLGDIFKRTLRILGRKVFQSEAFFLETAGGTIVQKLLQMARKEFFKELTKENYPNCVLPQKYLTWLMECALLCGRMAEDSAEATWLVDILGPFLDCLMRLEVYVWMPPVLMKGLLKRFVQAGKERWYLLRAIEVREGRLSTDVPTRDHISLREVREFLDNYDTLWRELNRHDHRLRAALYLFKSTWVDSKPDAVDAIMQHVHLERVESKTSLWEAAKCSALKPYFSKEDLDRVKVFEKQMRKEIKRLRKV